MNFVYVGLGGILGALARYVFAGAVFRFLKLGPPWGTFLVNITGCLAMGFLFSMVEWRGLTGPVIRNFLMIGFLGAYTTFSSYILESFVLVDQGKWFLGFTNLFLSIMLGLLAFVAGMALGKIGT